jgi:biopolymer transport protein ExbD
MAFGSFDQNQVGGHTVAEINMIPLIDVMLVLLVIFMITAPMMTHAVKIDLPKANSQAQQPMPIEPVNLGIDGEGKLFWNQDIVNREHLQ